MKHIKPDTKIEDLDFETRMTLFEESNYTFIDIFKDAKYENKNEDEYSHIYFEGEFDHFPTGFSCNVGVFLSSENITELPSDILVGELSFLDLRNCPNLKTIPEEVLKNNTVKLPFGYELKGNK